MAITPELDNGQDGDDGRAVSAPMVGRTAELELLQRQMKRLGRGEGGIVSLVGEAGIGKSRLVREALRGEQAQPARLLIARSVAVGQSLSFHPFADLLRGWAGIGDDTAEGEALARLEESLRALCAEEADEMLPFVASVMGLRPGAEYAERLAGIDGEALERLVFRSLRTLFQRLAAEKPLLVFFEDVHWADRSSVQLLEHLLGLVGESPILFVLAFRPEHAETGQRLLALARAQYPLQHRLIELKRLDAAACAELARHLLGAEDAPRGSVARIVEKAEGSPFFVEEVVRSLIDAGAVELRDGRPHGTDRLAEIEVPGTVRELVAARLDRLEPASRELLEVASVIGRGFFGRIVAEVVGADAALDERLRHLVERGILLERRTRRTASHARRTLAQEVEYVFQHALVQETIYASIAAPTRRELHARVAAAVERLYAARLTDFYGVLAYHYLRAESPQKAEEYLFKAGEEAARSAASSEALTFFREASRLYLQIHGEGGDAAKKAQLERNIAMALMNTGELSEAMPHFDRALAHLGTPRPTMAGAVVQFAGDAAAVFARLWLPSSLFSSTAGQDRHRDEIQVLYARIKAQSTSDPTRLVFDYFHAVRLLNRTDPAAVPDQVIGLYGGFAALFAYSGLSFRLGRRYLALADGLRRPGHAKDLFDQRCLACISNYLEGRWGDDEGTVSDEVVTAALRYGGLWEVNTYLGLDADRQLRRGDFAGARRRIAQLGDMADTYGFAFARANQASETMLLLLEERDLEAALDAANLYQTMVDDPPRRVLALGSKAKAQVLRGDLAGAAATLAAAERVIAASPVVPPWHLSAYAVARLTHDLAALEAAGEAEDRSSLERRARSSASAAYRISSRVAVQRGEIFRLTAQLHHLLADEHGAAGWLAKAIAECERLGARPELARAHLDAATWGLDLGDDRTPEAHVARARELFESIGLSPATPLAARRAA